MEIRNHLELIIWAYYTDQFSNTRNRADPIKKQTLPLKAVKI